MVARDVNELLELFVSGHVYVVDDVELELFHETVEAYEGCDFVEHGVHFDVVSLLPDLEQRLAVHRVDVVVLGPDPGSAARTC